MFAKLNPHLIHLIPWSQTAVSSGCWTGPDELHAGAVELGEKVVVGRDDNGETISMTQICWQWLTRSFVATFDQGFVKTHLLIELSSF